MTAKQLEKVDVRLERAKALYSIDENAPSRKSHENQEVITLYETYLKQPGSHIAHHLLHTSYNAKTLFEKKPD
jgi:NADP-reducing hydrogenase subunit HndD